MVTAGGLSRIEHGHVQAFTPSLKLSDSGVYDILRDRAGRLWTGGQGGLVLWEMNSPRVIRQRSSDVVTSIAEGPDGTLWLATSQGLRSYSQKEAKAHTLLPGDARVKARCVLVDRDGAVWVGTLGQGLFHLSGGRMERITRSDGLSSDTVYALFEDREGNIWAGTQNGIDRFREYKVASWSTRQGLPGSNVSAILAEPNGDLCAGIEAIGVYCFPSGHLRRLPSMSTSAGLADSGGDLVVATAGGVFKSTLRGTISLSNRLDRVYSVAQDRDHSIWFGDIGQGLFRFRNGEVDQVAADRFAGKPITFLLGDRKGRLWIALNPGPLTLYQEGAFHSFSSANGLGSEHVVSLFEDHSGTIWVATDRGLSRYDGNGRFVTLTARNGLPCDSMQDILEDDLGYLWLRTSCGLIRVKLSDLATASASPATQIHYELFGPSSGFQTTTRPHGTTPRAAKTTDGRLWFIAGDGIAVIDPRRIRANTVPPPVHVERVIADGKVVNLLPKARLSPNVTRLQVDYTALSLTDPDRVFFKYKIEGLDESWVNAGTQRQASYTNLRPGAYRFRVIACNNDGVWNEAGADFPFVVEAAFLQMRLFAWFCAGLLMVLISVFYRVRLHRALTPVQVLNLLVKFYPDGIPGYGLALARLWIGTVLLAQAAGLAPFAGNSIAGFEPSRVLEAVAGAMVLAGFLTPMVSVLVLTVIMIEIVQRAATNAAFGSLVGSWENALPIVLSILLLMGPGAYSVDAHVFGRRFLTVRGQSFRNKK